MDVALTLILIICGIVLALIPLLCFFIFSEVKEIRKEMPKIEFSINQINTSLLHQASKIETMNKHLGIIGSKAAPERYKKRSSVKR
jgi:hypothetical protein